MIGTMAESVVGFSFARYVARDWISRKIPQRFTKYNESLEKRGFATVFFLRFVFWMPPLLHAFFGVSRVRFWTHFWGSLIGYVPPLLLVSYLGDQMFDASGSMQPGAWPIMAGLIVASLAILALFRAYTRRRTSAAL